jgi:hypothetical protein
MDTLFNCVEEYKAACYDVESDWLVDTDGEERRLEGELISSQEDLMVFTADEAVQPQEVLLAEAEGEADPEEGQEGDHSGPGRPEHAGGERPGGLPGGRDGELDGHGPRDQRPGHPDGERPEHPRGGKRGGRGGNKRRALNEEVARKLGNCPNGDYEHFMDSLSPQCGILLYKLAASDSMPTMGGGPRGNADHQHHNGRHGDESRDDHDGQNVHHWKNFFQGEDDDRNEHHFDDEDEHHFPRILILGAIAACGVYGYRRYNKRDSPVETAQPQQHQLYPQQPLQGVQVYNGQPQIATGAPIFFQATAPAVQPGSKVSPASLPSF